APPSQSLRSSTRQRFPALASSAAPASELMPLPTKTTSYSSVTQWISKTVECAVEVDERPGFLQVGRRHRMLDGADDQRVIGDGEGSVHGAVEVGERAGDHRRLSVRALGERVDLLASPGDGSELRERFLPRAHDRESEAARVEDGRQAARRL